MKREELATLVKRAQDKEVGAYDELFAACYNDVYYFALKTLNNSDIAADVTQESMLEIFRTLGQLKEPLSFPDWMRKITHHQCMKYYRKKKEVLVEENDEGETIFDLIVDDSENAMPVEFLEKKEVKDLVRTTIDDLSEEQRSAVMMYYFDELSITQIADIQAVPEGTVKSRLNYARKTMQKKLEAYEKKHDIKLHAIPLVPLFRVFFEDKSQLIRPLPPMGEALAEAAAEACTAAIETAAETTVGVAEGQAAATAAAGTKAVGFAAIPLWGKAASIATAVLLTVGTMFGVSKLINQPCDVHTFGDWSVLKAATCTETGEQKHSCTVCGLEKTEIISKTPHAFGVWQNVGSSHIRTCSCGAMETEDHAFGAWQVDGDNHIRICSCRATQTETHTFGDFIIVKEATCLEDGDQKRICFVCGLEENEPIPMTGHVFEEWRAEGDHHVHTCVCGMTETEPHTYGDWIVVKTATCTEIGEQKKICSVCGADAVVTIPATGHTEVVDAAVKATSSATGKTAGSHCGVCGAVIKAQEILPKIPTKAQISKLKTDMDALQVFFTKLIKSSAGISPEDVLSMYLFDMGYHGPQHTSMANWGSFYIDNEIVAEEMKKQGWTDTGKIGHSADPVYARSVPRSEIDAWTMQHFGMTYQYKSSMILHVDAERVFDVQFAYYNADTDSILFEATGIGFGGPGGGSPWEDFCSYDGKSTMSNDYTITFDYTLHTTEKPAKTTGVKQETIYLYKDDFSLEIAGPDVFWFDYNNPTWESVLECKKETVWLVPAKLTFRYNGETFEFVSLKKQ